MYSFGKESSRQLATCDERLQRVFNEVIKHVDCSILEGFRDQATQDKYYREGKSGKQWPTGEHNTSPSRAVDCMVYPIDWNEPLRQCLFAGFVIGTAASMGIKLRWGGDWDSDFNLKEHTLFDTPHFELQD
jgi:peptidoglycan L-alanyl-D-glutamate endopeptidase CwlK